jgi:hypothetical protein
MPMNYNLSVQEKDYFCVPAIFQAILRRHGFEESQEGLARKLNCEPPEGTKITTNFYNLFTPYGLKNEFLRTTQVLMGDPTFLIDSWASTNGDFYIFSETSGGNRHARLAIGLQDRQLLIQDPGNLKITKENLDEIYSHIAKTKSGGFGLITSLENPHIKLLEREK